jgi:NAD(P)-dependent dehydrogenase (short-subunit alcohol dehydrogenase family)
MPLKGKQIVIAGGAGGIGITAAQLLAEQGAHLVISYRSNADHAQRARPYGEVVQCDITVAEDRARLLDAAPALYGLVVLAGDPARAASPAEFEAAARRSHDVNYLGPVLLAREAAQRMKDAGTRGAIVLTSTMQAVGLFPGSIAYAGAKSALVHAARILAKENRGPSNIRVNVISPGVTAAGMAEASIAAGKYNRYLDEAIVHRFGQALDVARAIRFFLEPDSYVTGQVLSVDGGLTL